MVVLQLEVIELLVVLQLEMAGQVIVRQLEVAERSGGSTAEGGWTGDCSAAGGG